MLIIWEKRCWISIDASGAATKISWMLNLDSGRYIEPVKDISDKNNQNIFWELGILLFLVYVKRNSKKITSISYRSKQYGTGN